MAVAMAVAMALAAAASPGPGVGVGVPGLLLHPQGGLGQDGTEPGRDVFPDVIDFVCVLTRAARPVFVRLVLQDLHAAALAAALLPALFLQRRRRKKTQHFFQ